MPGTSSPGSVPSEGLPPDIWFQGSEEIPSKQIGYVLRILGQNPTEDDIVEMVMKVGRRTDRSH